MIVNKIHQGDSLVVLKTFPDNSVDCVVTSPPYWGLRDYQLPSIIWDNHNDCKHSWNLENKKDPMDRNGYGIHDAPKDRKGVIHAKKWEMEGFVSGFCTKCNAWSGQLGLEPTFDLYLTHLLQIFDEIKRILKKEGTCFINLGDSYSGSGNGTNDYRTEASKSIQGIGKNRGLYKTGGIAQRIKNVAAKSLCQIPFRFSIDMSDRGWILRNTLIWHKPNCMPSSVRDRFTVDFEYVFFFVKDKKYWFETQYEKYAEPLDRWGGNMVKGDYKTKTNQYAMEERPGRNVRPNDLGRNKRCVWTIPTQPYSEAHFAVYPEKLIKPMILSGCPEQGIVLDPFFGSGTTGLVALRHNRNFIGIELNPEYIKIAEKRLESYLLQEKLEL